MADASTASNAGPVSSAPTVFADVAVVPTDAKPAAAGAGAPAAPLPASAGAAPAAAGAGSATAAAAPSFAAGGVVLVAGSVAHSMTGRKEPPTTFDGVPEKNLYSFHVLETLRGVPIASVASHGTSCSYFAVSTSGDCYAWGRNERGQLGLGHTKNVFSPAKVPGVPAIASAATGRGHTLLVATDGSVYAAGDSKLGQTGLGEKEAPVTKFTRVPELRDIVQVACGADFSVALDSAGRLFNSGTEAEGVCGTGRTGEYIVSAGKTAFQTLARFTPVAALAGHRFTRIACGSAHTLALEDSGQVYSWGSGGYGRCGHGDAKDVLSPRAIKAFEPERMRVAAIFAGSTASFFVTRVGTMTYLAGITKKSGEANTSPKPVYDLQGWKPRAIACGATSTVVAADANLIAWGPSPTSGELGLGDAVKSSTTPKLVDALNGTHVLAVAAGLAASLIVVDCSSATKEGEAGKSALAAGKWPVYDPAGDQAIAAAWKGGKGGPAAGAGSAEEAEEPVTGKKRSAGAAGAKGKATGGSAPKKGRK